MALTPSSRRMRGLAVAACAALTLPVMAAAPAVAQTTTTTSTVTAETAASAIRLTINLPSALPINPIRLDIDPVSGAVRSVNGGSPEAEALATIISGSIGENAQSFPGAEARLPEPKEDSADTNELSDGINDSPLGSGENAFLQVGLVTASASVTEAPSSTSEAQIADLQLGLPAALADALAQVLTPLIEELDALLEEAAPLDEVTQGVCEGLEPVTVPLEEGVEEIPVLGPLLGDVVDGTLSVEQGILCNLRAFLVELQAELGESLLDLAGPGGILSAGLVEASQTITTEGARTAAEANARIADLEVLGLDNPFGDVTALETTSTAIIDGATSEANVDATAVEAYAEPLLVLETDLRTVTGDLTGITIDGLNEILVAIQAVLDGLAGIGVVAGPLDEQDAAIASCPAELTPQLSGTFEDPGVCAAAASLGFGLAILAPAELAGPLGIEADEEGEFFPLIALQIVPTAALVRADVTTTTTQPTTPEQFSGPLPRTGAESLLAGAGVALLIGAGLVRRRRATAGL